VPPTERKGRVQTSTVTVAVFELEATHASVLLDSDIETFTARGSGKGGQHRNKTDSAVRMRHKPTGIEAYVDGRCQHQNRRSARSTLEARVYEHLLTASVNAHNIDRKNQIGTGMRGDKIRTYREQDDTVMDHVTGRRARLRDLREGNLQLLP
jgi:peptide chain release factor 1